MTVRLERSEFAGQAPLHLKPKEASNSHLTKYQIVKQKPLVNIPKTRVLIVKASKYSATSLMYCHCASDGDFNPLHQI